MVNTTETRVIPDWLARIYPFQPKTIVTPGGAQMSYLDEGPRGDRAVLMVHGNPTWSFYYRNLVNQLSASIRCIVPDHVGMGLSEKPPHYPYSLASRIADLEALVMSLGLRRVDLVVHDWGGAIGFGFAARHPEMISRLVILNTAAFPAKRIPARIAFCKLPFIGPLIIRGMNGFARPATWMAMHRCALGADEKRAYLLPYDTWANRVAVNAFVQDIPMRPTHPTWPTLTAVAAGLRSFRDRKALIIWGGRDFCFNESFRETWTEIFPQAEQKSIPDAGHYVIEDAAEIALPVAVSFLTGGG